VSDLKKLQISLIMVFTAHGRFFEIYEKNKNFKV
jgi:hypothetical protein